MRARVLRAGIAVLSLGAAWACETADRARSPLPPPPPFRGPGAPPRGNRLRLVIAPAADRITSADSVVIRYRVRNEGPAVRWFLEPKPGYYYVVGYHRPVPPPGSSRPAPEYLPSGADTALLLYDPVRR